jgi:glycosyltransferase involved in cell wall biosynthesis
MKIALITLEYPPQIMGGAGVYVGRIAPQLARLGYEIHVITPGAERTYSAAVEQGVRVHRLPTIMRNKTIGYWAALPFAFRRIAAAAGGFDLVHGNGVSDLTLSRLIAPQPRVVTVHHLSASCVQVLKPSLARRLSQPGGEMGLVPHLEPLIIRRAQHLIAVSDHTRAELIATLGIHPARISVIRHAAQPEEYAFPAAELAGLRASLGVHAAPMILCVGRLEPRKGIDILLKAFALMPTAAGAKLVLAGGGEQAPYREQAARLGIGDQVIFAGRVDDTALRRLYAACDLVAFPSLMEGLGIVALEARAAGKRVVASRVGGIPEVVPPGAGTLVPPGMPEPLAKALLSALCEPQGQLSAVPGWAEAARQLGDLYQRQLPPAQLVSHY